MGKRRLRVFAVLGDPVQHSLSPVMHNAAFRALGLSAVYVPLRCSSRDLPGLLGGLARAGGGGNVTVPHKELAARLVQDASPAAREVGACNTFWRHADRVRGDNTDVHGVLEAMAGLGVNGGRWLIAGTGGGARAVVVAARRAGAAVAVRSRDPARADEFRAWISGRNVPAADAEECDVVVNATPLGLRRDDPSPVPLEAMPAARAALDLVYAPGSTPWVQMLRQRGLEAADGRTMLLAQGMEAFRRWFPDRDPPAEVMKAALDAALR
jgi:shikimate dehydrogenase